MKGPLFAAALALPAAGPVLAQTPPDIPPAPPPAATPLPVELMGGHRQLTLQTVVSKKFAPESRFSFFNLTTFGADYRNTPGRSSYLTSASLKYELVRHVSAFGGLNINSAVGFRPSAGIEFQLTNPVWFIVAQQGGDLTETHNLQSLALVEYKPRLSARLALYSRAQGLYSYDPQARQHALSYVYLRLGLSWGTVSAGVAANLSHLGPEKIFRDNYGVFVRHAFF